MKIFNQVALAFTALLCATALHAAPGPAPFGATNVVVYRVGNGVGICTNTGNPVFLDEYTPSGTLVQSIALPTTTVGTQYPLIASGTATSEGFLTCSVDGRYLLVPGYDYFLGGAIALPSTTASSAPRVIGRVDSFGNVDTSTGLANWTSVNSPRSAASPDGSWFWGAGGAGINFAGALGTNNSAPLSNTTPAAVNARVLGIYNGKLYVTASSASITRGIATVGSGLPTSGNQAYTILPGMTDNVSLKSPYGFFLCRVARTTADADTLYVCDDTTTGAPGGINKFSLVAGSWVANGSFGAAADAYRGLCGIVNGTTVTLYATRKGGSGAAGGGELVQWVDVAGYNAAPTATSTLLATATANTAFRGVALAPAACRLSYNGNGNTSGTPPTDSNVYAVGGPATVAGPGNLKKTSYTFAGWNTTANGSGAGYNPGAVLFVDSNIVLYAQWLPSASSATYQAILTGPGESPPNASPGTGFATVTYNNPAHTLTVDLTFNGLVGTTTASHIHAATTVAGTGTAGVATTTPTFTNFPIGVTSGLYSNVLDLTQSSSYNAAFITANGGTTATAEAALVAALGAGEAYLNIHTTVFPGGEIRGFLNQIIPPALINPKKLGNGSFQFSFTNVAGASFTVYASTNVAVAVNLWTSLGTPVESPAGTYTFTDPQATNTGLRFYRVSSP